ncbi:hypothetical protein ABN097_06560 [Enterobacter cloacae]|uniref:hypothetical protein n=1 Tax=Enterobacter cloacae TaxID=550 RepID=UPI0032DA10CA
MDTKNKPRNHRSAWTLKELRFVEEHYGKIPTRDIAVATGRTPVSVRAAARSLGCGKIQSMLPWTEDEVAILRTHYAGGAGIHRVSELLPGRNPRSICAHARKLGIQSGRHLARAWSEEELVILKQYYPALGVRVAEKLPGRTQNATKLMANSIGIHYSGGKEHGAHQRIWTDEEWRLLLRYAHLSPSELMKFFPGRTRESISHAKARMRRWGGKKR